MGQLVVLSRSPEPYLNRMEAGRILARELREYVHERPVVAGIPRGGVVVAREVAREFDAELDIVLSRKLGAPGNPELAIGAVAEDDTIFINDRIAPGTDELDPYIVTERNRQQAEIERRRSMIREVRPKVPFEGRCVIIVDDGIATGSTMEAALWSARNERPSRLIAALPVAPVESLRRLTADADLVLCVRAPDFFSAVGQFYEQFPQVEDRSVLEMLKESYQIREQEVG